MSDVEHMQSFHSARRYANEVHSGGSFKHAYYNELHAPSPPNPGGCINSNCHVLQWGGKAMTDIQK
jgi:hypothetical protein